MVDGIQNFGSLVGQTSASATSQQQTQALSQDVGQSYFAFGNYGLQITNTKLLIEYQNVGNSFILGSSTNGILGLSLLGALNMIWGNSGSIWGTVTWGGTLPNYSTIYENDVYQPITDASKLAIASWFIGTSVNPPIYVALGIGNSYFEDFSTTTYEDVTYTTAHWQVGGLVL